MTTTLAQPVAGTLTPELTGGMTREQIELIKRTVCQKATDDELALFLHVVRKTGLDPFTGQIHAVKRWSTRDNRDVMTIQVGIDGLRLTADRTGKYAGNSEPTFEEDSSERPLSATVTVQKLVGDSVCSFTGKVRWKEFAQYVKAGQLGIMWIRMPYHMLAKCAEALALRKAFPAELSGLFVDAEIPALTAESEPDEAAPKENPAPALPPQRAEKQFIWTGKIANIEAKDYVARDGPDKGKMRKAYKLTGRSSEDAEDTLFGTTNKEFFLVAQTLQEQGKVAVISWKENKGWKEIIGLEAHNG